MLSSGADRGCPVAEENALKLKAVGDRTAG